VDELDYINSICLDPSVDKKTRDLMQDGIENRIRWIKKMLPKGLEILIATEKPKDEIIHYKWVGKMKHSDLTVYDRVPMGLLEFIPIEFATEPIKGKDILFINCVWILPPFWNIGVGKALMTAFIDKVMQNGGGCVISYDGDRWFETSIRYMPSGFFKKFGFKEVERDGTRVLVYLDAGSSSPPEFLHPNNESSQENDKIKIEICYNCQCPWSKFMVNSVTTKLEYQSDVSIKTINTDDRKIIEKLGISRGVRINGNPIIRRLATWNEIETEIRKIG